MERLITGYRQDQGGDWAAQLSCGHTQHVRHEPPFQIREWVLEAEGRAERLGSPMDCPLCDRAEPPAGLRLVRTSPQWEAGDDGGSPLRDPADAGGDPACWSHLLCPDCGVVLDGGGHRPGCRS